MTITAQPRALVAGGAGFLGSHLCEALLAQGFEVVCLDNLQTGRMENLAAALAHPRFSYVDGDITHPLPAQLSDARFQEVYNLACAASPPAYQLDPEHTMLTCVVGTQRLLRLAELHGARFLLTSTSEVYGDPLEHPQTETYRGNVNPTGPRACYDEGKRAAETLAFDYDRLNRATVRVARIFNTYGPRLDPEDGRVVSNLVVQALAGKPMTIYGDGRQTRSFCFVEDMIAGLLALMRYDGPQPGPVNLGNPNEVTILQLAEQIADLTGCAIRIDRRQLPLDDPQRRKPDIARAGALLGWQPSTPLAEGLQMTIDAFARTASWAPPQQVVMQPELIPA